MAQDGDGAGAKGPDIAAGRLPLGDYSRNFDELHPPLSNHEAAVEADRCYFCHDAPCTVACPTAIDVPLFIRQIQADNPLGAATTIFEQNILGGMCARVCPTETLCEQACVRNNAEDRPVQIGLLQRFATDHAMARPGHPFTRAAQTGKRVAIVGAGPAGLSCAHQLARFGHQVTIFEARDKPGGLNEYGIAAYKTVNDFAAREVAFVTAIGGIEIVTGKALGRDLSLAGLREEFDAVFLGLGLGGVNHLGIDGDELAGVEDAIAWIARLRQADDLSALPVGRRVVVIGGGMTAIDVAVQNRLLGAEEVTIVYRRGSERMSASDKEQALAQTSGVIIRTGLQPKRIIGNEAGQVRAIELEYTSQSNGELHGTGQTIMLAADMVFRAIGQSFDNIFAGEDDAPQLKQGRIGVDETFATSLKGVWAGGDCIAGGDDLTVTAVDDGRRAGEAIHKALSARALSE